MANNAEALATALEHHRAGRLLDADQGYRRVLAADPNEPQAIHLLGVIAYQQAKPELAVEYISRAIGLNDSDSVFHSNLGNAFAAQRKLDEAIACYRRALTLNPNSADVYYNLANALKQQAKLDEAIACYRRALELQPDFAAGHINLGNALRDRGILDEALSCFRRALDLNPNLADLHVNLGNVLQDQGDLNEAIACYRRALELNPHSVDTHVNLGVAFRKQAKTGDAADCLGRAVQLSPDNVVALTNLATVFQDQHRLNDAVTCYRRALELDPNHVAALNNLGSALKDQGNLSEAIVCFDRAIELQPDFAAAHSNRLYTLNFCSSYDARQIYAEHVRWNEQFAGPLAARGANSVPRNVNERSADRRLRIGYVSPDFREHAVGRFLLPLLESHDHEGFEIHCYSAVRWEDATTERCRAQADAWHRIVGLSDEQLADRIRRDRVDILVDLTMHMADNRLLAFARRPAPVQVSYLAYSGTTGLAAMDYRLTDPYLDPPDQCETIYSEESIRLPETYWCYKPPIEVPPINPLPAFRAGHITFGCLNNFCKVSDETLATWGSLLQALPTARLLLHAYPGSHRERVTDLLARQGVLGDRLMFADTAPLAEYYGYYHQIDLALDPFPYGGGTTTCDALWMGVPVVTLAGKTAVGRGGLSILSNLGLTECVAHNAEQYVRIASQLAADPARLGELRTTLRKRMQASPLMDAPRFACHVEDAYRKMWQRWLRRAT